MTTNFNQNSSDLDLYLIPISNKDIVPQDKRKPGTLWGSWGSLWTWGVNSVGSLGLSDSAHRSSPVQVGSLTDWKMVSASAGIKIDGTMWIWGQNGVAGALGLNDNTSRSSPTQIGSLTNWSTMFFRGGSRGYAIKTDGTLWTWGDNTNGELGLNDRNHRSSPVQVGSLTNWKMVTGGQDVTAAVKTDGTLWTWGENSLGQLGLNDRNHRSSPVQVGTMTNWSDVKCAYRHMIALKSDGTLWSWGRNAYFGELGLNDKIHRSSPTQVGSLTNWAQIQAADANFAIKTDGTLWGWGTQGSSGTLGLSELNTYSSPVQIGTLTNWSLIACRSTSPHAIKTDGTMWSWGENSLGQLGLNDRITRSSPVQIGSLTSWIFTDGSGRAIRI